MRTSVIRDLDEVLDLLIDEQQIVGMYQGESEWGPRALGNRSIIFDPRHQEAKQIVNQVKKRETYRNQLPVNSTSKSQGATQEATMEHV